MSASLQNDLIPNGPFSRALAAWRGEAAAGNWQGLAFFRNGRAEAVMGRVDEAVRSGAQVLPEPTQVFRAFQLTPLKDVKVVILGQDPYPTPGDAHGLAFSCSGSRRLPASLRTILAEMAEDLSVPMPKAGDLSHWATQGVLLLNTCLTVEAGRAGAHLAYGWSELVDEAVTALSMRQPGVVFLLWGGQARRRAALVDRKRHLVIESGHPSPLNRLRDFKGTRPFSRANAWLAAHGLATIDWRLD